MKFLPLVFVAILVSACADTQERPKTNTPKIYSPMACVVEHDDPGLEGTQEAWKEWAFRVVAKRRTCLLDREAEKKMFFTQYPDAIDSTKIEASMPPAMDHSQHISPR